MIKKNVQYSLCLLGFISTFFVVLFERKQNWPNSKSNFHKLETRPDKTLTDQ